MNALFGLVCGVTLGACGVSIIERPVVTIAAIVVLSIAHVVMQ